MSTSSTTDSNGVLHGHTIKIAAQRTGLTTHAIRVWEKRYDAVTPTRTHTNRRLYTDEDIDRLKLLKNATQNGHSIGQIAHLPQSELQDLITQDQVSPVLPQQPDSASNIDAQAFICLAIEAAKRLDAKTLQSVLMQASLALSQPVVIETVIVPFMYQIGELWRAGQLRISHEHLSYAVVRTFLEGLKSSYTISPTAPQIVVATPTGQLHELGALIVSTIASAEGWQVTYLGASLPAEEIASATLQNNARVVALSLIYLGDDPNLHIQFTTLRASLPDDIPIIVGGQAAPAYRTLIQNIGAIEATEINDLRNQLNRLCIA